MTVSNKIQELKVEAVVGIKKLFEHLPENDQPEIFRIQKIVDCIIAAAVLKVAEIEGFVAANCASTDNP